MADFMSNTKARFNNVILDFNDFVEKQVRKFRQEVLSSVGYKTMPIETYICDPSEMMVHFEPNKQLVHENKCFLNSETRENFYILNYYKLERTLLSNGEDLSCFMTIDEIDNPENVELIKLAEEDFLNEIFWAKLKKDYDVYAYEVVGNIDCMSNDTYHNAYLESRWLVKEFENNTSLFSIKDKRNLLIRSFENQESIYKYLLKDFIEINTVQDVELENIEVNSIVDINENEYRHKKVFNDNWHRVEVEHNLSESSSINYNDYIDMEDAGYEEIDMER